MLITVELLQIFKCHQIYKVKTVNVNSVKYSFDASFLKIKECSINTIIILHYYYFFYTFDSFIHLIIIFIKLILC